MNTPVIVRECKHGKGLFATRDLDPGEVVLVFDGPRMTLAETKDPAIESYTVQVGPNEYINPVVPGRYINHSCEPNCGFDRADTLVAMRPIAAGEELVFDYSTSMHEDSWTMECRCESERCRAVVRDFCTLPEALQREYLSLGVVPDWLRRIIAGEDASVDTERRSEPARPRPARSSPGR